MTGRGYGVTLRRSAPLRLGMHPDAPDPGAWREWVTASHRPIAIDLFSGAGGLSHGLEAAGFRVALSVDIDNWALETHAHNFAGLALNIDLADEDGRSRVERLLQGIRIDLVAGGPPCQPFSRAGRSKIRSLVELGVRDAEDVRKELWRAFLDMVERIQPRAVLMENVPDMALGDGMVVLRHVMDRLQALGYEVDAKIVETWQYGVPQHRQRLILVGIRGAVFEWPMESEKVTVRDAIGDLPVLQVLADCPIGSETLPYNEAAASDFTRRARKQCVSDLASVIHDHLTRSVRPDDLEAFQLMKPGTLYSDLPPGLQRYRDDIFDDKYNRLNWDGYSRSITAHIAKDGYWYIHPEQHRTLTVREAARIQTFPDHFRFAGTRSHQFHQIGNAVPPALAEAIGTGLLSATHRDGFSQTPPSVWRTLFRKRLAAWAAKDRRRAPWSYPGDSWQAAVGLILSSKGSAGWPTPADVLEIAPSFEAATPRLLSELARKTKDGSRRRSVDRLVKAAAAVRKDPDGWGGTTWARAAGVGPAGRDWFELLQGRALGLVPSSAVLRVAARVTGTDVDRQNRLSAGCMEIAKLVGMSDNSAMLNVAMHRVGTLICKTEDPACSDCPVSDVCVGRLS